MTAFPPSAWLSGDSVQAHINYEICEAARHTVASLQFRMEGEPFTLEAGESDYRIHFNLGRATTGAMELCEEYIRKYHPQADSDKIFAAVKACFFDFISEEVKRRVPNPTIGIDFRRTEANGQFDYVVEFNFSNSVNLPAVLTSIRQNIEELDSDIGRRRIPRRGLQRNYALDVINAPQPATGTPGEDSLIGQRTKPSRPAQTR